MRPPRAWRAYLSTASDSFISASASLLARQRRAFGDERQLERLGVEAPIVGLFDFGDGGGGLGRQGVSADPQRLVLASFIVGLERRRIFTIGVGGLGGKACRAACARRAPSSSGCGGVSTAAGRSRGLGRRRRVGWRSRVGVGQRRPGWMRRGLRGQEPSRQQACRQLALRPAFDRPAWARPSPARRSSRQAPPRRTRTAESRYRIEKFPTDARPKASRGGLG